MAYASKYHVINKTDTGGTTTTYRIEVHENGFVGSSTLLDGVGGVFSHEYENIDPRRPFEDPVQKSRLELYFNVTDATDLAILTTIFGSDEDQYRLVKKVNGSVVWTGKVLPDLLEYSEGQYPFTGAIIAKDLSALEGTSYGLQSAQEKIIATIADILNTLGYGLDIHTFTNWENSNVTGDDYLNVIQNRKENLRNFATADGESDTAITDIEALRRILRSHNLILRQSNNVWNLYHISALQTPASVTRYVYNSAGTQQSSGAVDITTSIDRSSKFYLPSSMNIGLPALKRAKSTYQHRTPFSALKIPGSWTIQQADGDKTFSQDVFVSDGNQSLQFTARVNAVESTGSEAEVTVTFQVGSYYWDGSSWGTSAASETIPLIPDNGGYTSGGSFTIVTGNIPDAADGTMSVTLGRAESDPNDPGGDIADTTYWVDMQFKILNPSVAEGDSTAIVNELEQSGTYSASYDHGDTYFGDGPTSYSPGRLKFTGGDTDGDWRFVGEADTWEFSRLQLKEIMAWQRTPVRNLKGNLWGEYSPDEVAVHDSNNYFFMGGVQSGRSNRWDGNFVKLQFSDATDTFTQVFETTGSGTGSGGSGGSSTVSGSFQPLNANLTDISGLANTDGNFIVGDGSDFIAESGNTARTSLGLGDADDVTHNNLMLTGYVDLDQISTPANPSGNIARIYNVAEGGFSTLHYVNSSGIDFEISRDSVHIVRNETGAVISKGDLVYINGANGNFPTVALADASSISTMPVFGMVVADISDNSFGEVVTEGDVSGLDTSTFTEGDTLFASTTAGEYTATEPTGDNIPQVIGTVIKATASGIIEIKQGTLYDFDKPNLNATFAGIGINTSPTLSTFHLQENDIGVGASDLSDFTSLLVEGTDAFMELFADDAGTWAGGYVISELASDDTIAGKWGILKQAETTGDGGLYITYGTASNPWANTQNLKIDTSGNTYIPNGALAIGGSLTSGSTLTVNGDQDIQGSLKVTGGLFAKEFIVDVTRVQFDNAMTVGGGMVATVSGTAGSETITFEDEDGNSIVPVDDNDIIHIQQRTGSAFGTAVKNIWRKVVADSQPSSVVSLTDTGITWTAGEANDDTGSIEEGDNVVVKGNTSDTSRDHYINFQISGVTIPQVSVFDSVTDVDNSGDEIVRWGGLDSFNAGTSGNAGFAVQDSSGNLGFYASETKVALVDLDVEGTLTIQSDNSSYITNTDGDFSIYQDGVVLKSGTGVGSKLRWVDDVVPPVGATDALMYVSAAASPPFFELNIPDDGELRITGTGGVGLPTARVKAKSYTSIDGSDEVKTLADDTSTKIGELSSDIGFIHIGGADSAHGVIQNGAGFFLSIRAGTAVCNLMYQNGSLWEAGTSASAPGGTTGNDNKATLFLQDNGDIYINNRVGDSADFTYIITT